MQSSHSGIDTLPAAASEAREDPAPAPWGEALVPAPFGSRPPLAGLEGGGGGGEQTVWVRAAVTCDTQARSAFQIEEWALEAVMGSDEVVLSFLGPDGSVQSLLLKAVDAQDLAIALQSARRPGLQALN